MSIVGQGTCRFYRFNENNLKQFGFTKGENYHFLSHAWFKGERVLAGTTDGRILLFEKGEYKHEISVKNLYGGTGDQLLRRKSSPKLKERNDSSDDAFSGGAAENHSRSTIFEGKEVTAIVAYSKGFAAAVGVGNVVVFEEQPAYTTAEDHFKQMYVVNIPHDTSECEDRIITTLDISPNEEVVCATTFNCNIYTFQLSSAEIKV